MPAAGDYDDPLAGLVQRVLADYADHDEHWPPLFTTLTQVARQGHDPEVVLRMSAAALDLDSARSVVALLTSTIRRAHGLRSRPRADPTTPPTGDRTTTAPRRGRSTAADRDLPRATARRAQPRSTAARRDAGGAGRYHTPEPVITGDPAAPPRSLPSGEVKKLRADADEHLGGLVTGRDWASWLTTAARHTGLGVDNVTLIHAYRPGAGELATAEVWKNNGRTVRAGEAGTRLIVPVQTVDPHRGVLITDQVMEAFAATQLDGPTPPAEPQRMPMPVEVVRALTEVVGAAEFTVDYNRPDPGTDGVTVWATRRIHLRPDLPADTAVRVLAHELTHLLLHDPKHRLARINATSTGSCRGRYRVEADSVAYLIATRLGVDTGDVHFSDVAVWAGKDPRSQPVRAVRAVGERILTAAQQISTALDRHLPPQPALAAGPAPNLQYAAELTARGADSQRRAAALRDRAETTAEHLTRKAPKDPLLLAIHRDAQAFFQAQLRFSWVPEYLENKRRIGAEHQRTWGIGYAPAGKALATHLLGLRTNGLPRYTLDQLVSSGLVKYEERNGRRTGHFYDFFRDRMTQPIHDIDGNVVAFTCRKNPEDPNEDNPKYLNSPTTAIYTKSEELLGLYEQRAALEAGATPVFVEGSIDMIAIAVADGARYVGLPPLGTRLSSEQVAKLGQVVDLSRTGAGVALDSDRAGRDGTVKSFTVLSAAVPEAHSDPRLLFGVGFGDGRDPAQLLQDDGAAELAKALNAHRPLAEVVAATVAHRNATLFSDEKDMASIRRCVFTTAEGRLTAMRMSVGAIAEMLPDATREQIAGIVQPHMGAEAGYEEMRDAAYDLPPDVVDAVVAAVPPTYHLQLRQIAERFHYQHAFTDVLAPLVARVAENQSAPKRLTRHDRDIRRQPQQPTSRTASQPPDAPTLLRNEIQPITGPRSPPVTAAAPSPLSSPVRRASRPPR